MDNNYTLEGHMNKCRCCFKQLAIGVRHLKISSQHENNFYLLTQLELRLSIEFSNEICTFCDMELERYAKFRFDAMERQQKLYDLHSLSSDDMKKDYLTNFQSVTIVKEEPLDFNLRECSVVIEKMDSNHTFYTKEMKEDHSSIDTLQGELKVEEIHADVEPSPLRRIPPSRVFSKKRKEEDVDGKIQKWKPIALTHKSKQEYECDICGYSSVSRRNFQAHMRRKHGPIRFNCDKCSFRCRMLSLLEAHRNRRHSETLPPKLQCSQCERSFSQKYALDSHVRSFHEKIRQVVKKVFCKSCGRSFASNTYLKNHYLSSHTTQEPTLLCEFCPEKFFTDFKLNEHYNLVHREGNVKCKFEGCERTFNNTTYMKRHYRIHSKVKRFKCEKCGLEYAHSNAYKDHYQANHLGYRYWCVYPECKGEYKHKKDVRIHLVKHHTRDPEKVRRYSEKLQKQKPHIVNNF